MGEGFPVAQAHLVGLPDAGRIGDVELPDGHGLGRLDVGPSRDVRKGPVEAGQDNKRAGPALFQGFQGLDRVPVDSAEAGDIIIISGLDDIGIGVTICDKDNPVGLPVLPVDEARATTCSRPRTRPGSSAWSPPAGRAWSTASRTR